MQPVGSFLGADNSVPRFAHRIVGFVTLHISGDYLDDESLVPSAPLIVETDHSVVSRDRSAGLIESAGQSRTVRGLLLFARICSSRAVRPSWSRNSVPSQLWHPADRSTAGESERMGILAPVQANTISRGCCGLRRPLRHSGWRTHARSHLPDRSPSLSSCKSFSVCSHSRRGR